MVPVSVRWRKRSDVKTSSLLLPLPAAAATCSAGRTWRCSQRRRPSGEPQHCTTVCLLLSAEDWNLQTRQSLAASHISAAAVSVRNAAAGQPLPEAGTTMAAAHHCRTTPGRRKNLQGSHVVSRSVHRDFTWDEMAAGDLPALVGHVLAATGQPSIGYVGE